MSHTSHGAERAALRIGLVDLMSAVPNRPAQKMFRSAVESAATADGLPITFDYHAVDPLCAPEHCGIDWRRLVTADALIVTGSEPTRLDIESEPALAVVRRIIEDTADRVPSTLFSCQSAHAALYVLYGLRRRRLPDKYTEVSAHRVSAPGHPLTAGMSDGVPVPHSRWNSVPTEELHRAGVVPLLEADGDNWHLAASPDGLRQLFCQGHPEYRRDTLLREYQRDLRRHLAGETDEFPELPEPYLDEPARELVLRYAEKMREQRDIALLSSFPTKSAMAGILADWQPDTRRFFGNWLHAVAGSTARPTT
ncbi:homoserine O-acetyltransferase/O-succinyltransferase family protein [Streptomyces yunnanensis]|uniref:Homoserine O-succinyltransferase n=1 Tax=Streptomyces yunnanensis TaxID=156453 RepID=A0A9X8N490_9ACTN|nr:homoserine O-succinyltransferase [Streptomyces yunnanensis]SHM90782.1 homoserine O-succinyltransferase [Streptomyces yunnanensis]